MAEVSALVVQAIETRIRDNVASFGGTIQSDRIAWPGLDFEMGEDDWVRPTILFTEAQWLTDGITGTGMNLVGGLLTITAFGVPGYGMSAVDAYASAAREMFDRVKITIADHGDLEFHPASAPRPGNEDGAWLTTTVDIPFQIEEHG